MKLDDGTDLGPWYRQPRSPLDWNHWSGRIWLIPAFALVGWCINSVRHLAHGQIGLVAIMGVLVPAAVTTAVIAYLVRPIKEPGSDDIPIPPRPGPYVP